MNAFFARLASLLGWRRRPQPKPQPSPSPKWIEAQVLRFSYGKDAAQFIDFYIPAHWDNQLVPLIFMFHGGGWRRGDADADNVVANKVPWLNNLGIALASVSYRLGVDDTPPVAVWTEAEDIAQAIAWVRANGKQYGIDTSRMGGMGHSAGAHLGALVCTHADLLAIAGKLDYYIALDSAAWNVIDLFNRRKPADDVYVQAFNNTLDPPHCGPVYWEQCSPVLQIKGKPLAVYIVYSKERGPGDRKAAEDAYAAFYALDTRTMLVPVDKSHGALNADLGAKDTPENAAYTGGVEDFIREFFPL